MATLARQIPSPETFLCQPWSSFISAAQLHVVDKSSVDVAKTQSCQSETVNIRKEDLLVSSRFLALEDLSLVVCHVCNQVVTPQGILKHYDECGCELLLGFFSSMCTRRIRMTWPNEHEHITTHIHKSRGAEPIAAVDPDIILFSE